ncbi:MAG: CHRD domain-containing protein, partial [Nitrososphaeraceae archaeon]|nr:CHRD domain-containing protein [Nitrososphaeraceae archaeon]
MKAAVYRGHSKDPRQVVKILNVLEYYQFAMYKPKILVLGLAIAISIFSLAYTNLAIAQTEQTEGFTAALSGGEEVPPVDTTATGVASFTVMGEESVKYDVNVTGMDKVTAAHIHSAPKGENGEVVVTLFKADSPTGEISGSLANGTITNSTLEGDMQGLAVIDL